jgi:hypothetical protein
LPALFNTKPVLIRAFNAAKTKVKHRKSYGDDYVQKSEYRFLLKYLRMYYEYWIAFSMIDTDGDRRITFEEFSQAAPSIKKWGINMSDIKRQWSECDADGFGKVLFDEFCNWAIKKSLDLDDDDDVTDSDIEVNQINRV